LDVTWSWLGLTRCLQLLPQINPLFSLGEVKVTQGFVLSP
jgi:hypothetical protein